MAFTVELGIGQIITVQHDTATIGQDPASDICIPNSPNIQPLHAKILKVANKWMIQSAGDWPLKVGDGVPGRKLWLNPGDLVHLSESGPYIVFEPKQAAKAAEPTRAPLAQPVPPAAPAEKAEAESGKQPLPPFLQPVKQAPGKKPAAKPQKPQPTKQPAKQSAEPPDEEDEVWKEVFGYWMEEKQK